MQWNKFKVNILNLLKYIRPWNCNYFSCKFINLRPVFSQISHFEIELFLPQANILMHQHKKLKENVYFMTFKKINEFNKLIKKYNSLYKPKTCVVYCLL